jgi:5-methylcytosine-specific restriction endonuclease McrA
MERSSNGHEGVARWPTTQPTAGPEHLAILGPSDSSTVHSVHPQTPPIARPRGKITVANVLRLLESQGYRCSLTGRQLTPETASLDHVIPVRCGGQHVVENAQLLHRDVNRAKTTMTTYEFVQLCREVVEHAGHIKEEGGAT